MFPCLARALVPPLKCDKNIVYYLLYFLLFIIVWFHIAVVNISHFLCTGYKLEVFTKHFFSTAVPVLLNGLCIKKHRLFYFSYGYQTKLANPIFYVTANHV